MQMKTTYIKCFMAVALTMFMSACVEEDIEKGTPDLEDCMGVYFVEEQENAKDHILEYGEDETYLDFTLRRVKCDIEESVPFHLSAYVIEKEQLDTSYREYAEPADNIFKPTEILFKEGQKETSVRVRFNDIEVGKKYTCVLELTDPLYASVYDNVCTSITFTVQMHKWKFLGNGTYRDALFSDMFMWDGRYLESEVDIYERTDEDGKGYYRLDKVYTPEYMARLIDGEEKYENDPEAQEKKYSRYVEAVKIIVNATDPDHVYIPAQKTGFSDPSLGDVLIASDVAEVWGSDSNLLYGSLSEDGIITFPKNGLLISIGSYFYFSNSSGKFRIVLPGKDAKDYAVELEASEINELGAIPVKFTPAKDVASIRYAIFDGRVNLTEIESKVSDITEGKVKYESLDSAGETTVDISLGTEKTGFYTMIACTYDASGTYREYSTAELAHVKPGDDRSVQISFGVNVDDRLASENEQKDYNATNSFQYWVRGKDITHAMFNYYNTSYYNAYKDRIEESLKNSGSVDNMSLKMLNSAELSGVVGNKLKAGTEYTFVVYAKNGYQSVYDDHLTFRTEGTPDPMQKAYYYTDLSSGVNDHSAYTSDEWVPVSIDIFDSEAEGRTIRGGVRAKTVKFSYEDGKMTVSGLFPALKENPDIKFDYMDGKLYSTENTLKKVTVKDSTHIVPSMRIEYEYNPRFGGISNDGYFYDTYEVDDKERHDMIVAGFVNEDIIAFTDNNTKHVFWALILGGYWPDGEGGEGLVNFVGDAHGDLILVRKGSPLLESLSEGSSTGYTDDNQTLNSINEANRIVMPSIRSIITDAKKVDIAHEAVEFEAHESCGATKTYREDRDMFSLQENVLLKTIVR